MNVYLRCWNVYYLSVSICMQELTDTHSYLSENVFTAAIKGEALLIKSHIVSSTIDRTGSITLVSRALPLPVFTSAVNGLDGIRLITNDMRFCLYCTCQSQMEVKPKN